MVQLDLSGSKLKLVLVTICTIQMGWCSGLKENVAIKRWQRQHCDHCVRFPYLLYSPGEWLQSWWMFNDIKDSACFLTPCFHVTAQGASARLTQSLRKQTETPQFWDEICPNSFLVAFAYVIFQDVFARGKNGVSHRKPLFNTRRSENR